MARGRKSSNIISSYSYEDIFWKNLPVYINILNNYLNSIGFDLVEVGSVLDKLPFKLPKGLNSKEIKTEGIYPVISQSKDFIIGYSDNESLLVKEKLPMIVFGDHSKTIKYIENPFIIGADGVKILKPIKTFNEKFFYYFLHGVITDTKDYGRHFSLLRKGFIANVSDLDLQNSIVNFLDDLKNQSIDNNKVYFDKNIENKIYDVQINQINQVEISSELTHQLDLIKQLRQAFLREAMQGKLYHAVPTLREVSASQETGHDLLAKIKSERAKLITEKKLKKEKELSPITEEEIPFEIPAHWAWCRLGEICYTSGRIGWKGLSADEYQKSGPLFLSVHSLNYGDFVDYSKAFHITKERYDESPEIMLQNEDILICKDGAGIGKLSIIRNLTEPATINSSLLLIRKNLILNTKFVYYFFLSSHFQKIVQERIMGATTPHLYQRDIVGFPFALPPLHEQEQIVAKLEELMAFCDGLEESIKKSQGYNEKLLQQVLREALQGNTVINE